MTDSASSGEYVVMNVVEVPTTGTEAFEEAFAQRQSRLKDVDGFTGFELMRRDNDQEFLVISRWRDEDAFSAWRSSDHFKQAHRNADPESRPAEHRPTNSEVRNYTVVLTESA